MSSSELLQTIIRAVTSFAASNLDDIIVVTIFFSQVNASFRPRHIVLGQYLGFMAIILLSLPGFFGGLFLPESWIGLLGFVPIGIGLHQLWEKDDGDMVQDVTCKLDEPSSLPSRLLAGLLVPQVYHVAAVTIANGGDNIGIYMPLFASSSLAELLVILSTFLVMVAVWCGLARYFADHPALAPILTRYGHMLVPYVLIGLGLFILIDSGSYQLFAQLLS